MRILKLSFILLTMSGCWRPNSWSSLHKRIAYYVYTSITVFITTTFALSLLIDITIITDNVEDFCDTSFVLTDSLNNCFKVFLLLINRKNIIMIIDILTKKPCEPSTSTEINIVYKFDKSIENTTWWYVYIEGIAYLFTVLSLLFINFRNRVLPYRAWFPFDYSSTFLFSLMFTYQMIGLAIIVVVGVGCDTFICGLLVHICCQIEISTHRLRRITSHSNVLRDCVRHHYDIYRLASIVNERFRLTIAIQFIISTLGVCFCLYQLSIATTKARHIEMACYMTPYLIQIFFYCWYGNELKTKSQQMSDNIYEMEWLTLDKNRQKSLMIIMRRSTVPIQITCAYIVPMNLETFISILKMSYSIYNLLIQNIQV
ncbi:odorant receptor 2a-like [Temnothorax nylanderi]|uniref:odorant receptor 2a-like n=1 Tax=Temnothorax nylanderi TaxID=102681 RepID=UPI003A8960DC